MSNALIARAHSERRNESKNAVITGVQHRTGGLPTVFLEA